MGFLNEIDRHRIDPPQHRHELRDLRTRKPREDAPFVILTLPKLLSGPGVQLAGWATIAIFLLGCALVDRFYDGPLRDWMTRRAIAHRLLPLSRDQKADATTRPL